MAATGPFVAGRLVLAPGPRGVRLRIDREDTVMAEKYAAFRALHAGGIFVIANAWDAGSARVLAGLGFAAIATSSSAAAGTLGRLDGEITRAEAMEHARAIAAAVALPVSADLENGFGHAPADVAATVALAVEAGLAGCTIEDASGIAATPIYDFEESVARVAAAVAARPAGFMLTARSENFLRGRLDLDDTIRRLQAYARVGADVLMAPGLPDLDAVRAVCAAVDRPVNFMAGIPGKSFKTADLAACGVRRISLATSLYRAAMGGMVAAAEEVLRDGSFGYVDTALSGSRIAGLMQKGG